MQTRKGGWIKESEKNLNPGAVSYCHMRNSRDNANEDERGDYMPGSGLINRMITKGEINRIIDP